MKKEEVFITCHIGDDYIEKEIEQWISGRNNDSGSNMNKTANTDGTSLLQTGIGQGSSPNLPSARKIQRNVEELADNHTRWDSKRVTADQEGTAYV